MNGFSRFEKLMKKLEVTKALYDLKYVREGFVMVAVATPGKRWEIEVNAEGEIEVEVFVSDGKIMDESALKGLWKDLR